MADLGARLRQARQTKGVSLRDIATTTKISVVALEALERNDYSRLPGGIFSRAFVRAYALAVDVDPEAAVQEFLTEFARYQKEAERSAKRPEITADDLNFLERQRRALRTLRLVLVMAALVALAALGYLALVWWPPANSGTSPSIPAPQARSAPRMPAAAASFRPFGSHLR